MYDFMEYCLRYYFYSTGWKEENQYSNLCSWSRDILDFIPPQGLALNISRSPSPEFKPSYTMNIFPSLHGSIGYLYTSRPLNVGTSSTIDYLDFVNRSRFHCLANTRSMGQSDGDDALLYGRMFFPGAHLEAMYVRRITERLQFLLKSANNPKLTGLPQMAMQLQYDTSKWCSECYYSTDDGLLGIQALYNIGQRDQDAFGQWSVGTELYYGTLDKSAGLSTGFRYRAHLTPNMAPMQVTYTLNPIVGHMSTSYTAQVSEGLVLSSRFEFSVYSYDSDLAMGVEWQTNKTDKTAGNQTRKLEGVLKARLGISNGLACMWQGRFRSSLFSIGFTADLQSRSGPIRTFGIEFQHFS